MNRPTVYSDNPDIVPTKIWFSKGFFGGGVWKVRWRHRGKRNSSYQDQTLMGKSHINGNQRLNGTNFNYTVDWSD